MTILLCVSCQAHSPSENEALLFLSKTKDKTCLFFFGDGVSCVLTNYIAWKPLLDKKNIDAQVCSNSYHTLKTEFDLLEQSKKFSVLSKNNLVISGLMQLVDLTTTCTKIINITNAKHEDIDDSVDSKKTYYLKPGKNQGSQRRIQNDPPYLILQTFLNQQNSKKTIEKPIANQNIENPNVRRMSEPPTSSLQRTIDCYNLFLALDQKAKLVLPYTAVQYLIKEAKDNKNSLNLNMAVEFGLTELFCFDMDTLQNHKKIELNNHTNSDSVKNISIDVLHLNGEEFRTLKSSQRHIMFN